MLKEVFFTTTEKIKEPCVLLLGGFDGLHIGHQKLIEKAKTYHLPIAVMTIQGGKGECVFDANERRNLFSSLGIEYVLELPFDEKLKNTDCKQFVDELLSIFTVKAFVCGTDFRFGKGALGTPSFLRDYTSIPVDEIPLLQQDGIKISTTMVKEYLRQGNVEKANFLLLQDFSLSGKVIEGRKVGRTIHFPTINIEYPMNKIVLKKGVYSVRVKIENKVYRGIANWGTCPTFGITTNHFETYIDDFSGNLYGKNICVIFQKYLRDIIRFDSATSLAKQLQQDIQSVKGETL